MLNILVGNFALSFAKAPLRLSLPEDFTCRRRNKKEKIENFSSVTSVSQVSFKVDIVTIMERTIRYYISDQYRVLSLMTIL